MSTRAEGGRRDGYGDELAGIALLKNALAGH
jgi:hypothetical protein